MLNRFTGLVLLYVEPHSNTYVRYAACAGRKVSMLGRYHCERAMTQSEAEALRVAPEQFTAVA